MNGQFLVSARVTAPNTLFLANGEFSIFTKLNKKKPQFTRIFLVNCGKFFDNGHPSTCDEDIISAKDRKIIALVDQILSYTKYSDVTTEPETYSSNCERDLWAKRHRESEYDLEVQKKYTFRDLAGK